jgi:signal transduction histidine kinase
LNGAADEVDRIRNAVFDNEIYDNKPVGTATIFMGDLRISTNVQDNQGLRAVGTRVSREVAEHVLQEGKSWTGRAFVVDTWYLSQYDPIKDPDGEIIGMLYVGELEQKYLDMRTKAVVSILSVLLAGMVLTFILSFLFVKNILGPIRQLSFALTNLSNGNLGKQLPVRRKDEVGDLTLSFNTMIKCLEEQRLEIERRQAELEDLNKQLQSTNRNYMEMLGFVSHELKNPLASAIMGLYTVKDGYLGETNKAQKKALTSVAMSLDYFHEMIRNYLDLSRLEKGELLANKRRVALKQDVVDPVVDSLDYGLQEKSLVLNDHIPDTVKLDVDPDLIKIVYDNLLSNAIKYGKHGGIIELDAHTNNGSMTLSVKNDGEGIPPEKMPLLFKKFSRLDNPETLTQKGTGLGLFICKEIVEKHGGQIWVDSKEGQWVKFNFTLPRSEE